MPNKQQNILASLFLIVLLIAMIPFASAYNTTIQSDPSIDLTTKFIVQYIPLMLAMVALFISFVTLYYGAKR